MSTFEQNRAHRHIVHEIRLKSLQAIPGLPPEQAKAMMATLIAEVIATDEPKPKAKRKRK